MRQPNAAGGSQRDPRSVLRDVIDGNRYMTLATADGDGRPWASPVWYAHHAYTELYWVSRPDTRHSRNLTARPDVAIVIFDSSASIGGAQAVYLEAQAEELTDSEQLHRAIETYSRRSKAQAADEWTTSDVTATAPHRLYRATASAHFVLAADDSRVAMILPRAPRSRWRPDTG